MDKIAVIMSLYKNDRLEYLKLAIDSVLKQTYTNLDFYIQCDGEVSHDCSEYLEVLKDDRVNVRRRKENKGLAFSLNEMLKVVIEKGYSFIVRMDADDICVLDRFEKQIKFLMANPNIDICGGCIDEFNLEENTKQFVGFPEKHDEMKSFFGKRNPLAHMTVVFRKSYFEKAGLYPENTRLDEDTMFWLQGFKNDCIFANIPEVLVNVRVNSDFYGRRNGFHKSYGDFKNRLSIIRELKLSYTNYFFAFLRFVIMGMPFPFLTKLAYKLLRK